MKWFSDRFTCKRCTQTGIWFLKPFERFYASTIDFARRHVKIFRSLDKDDFLCQSGPLYFKCKLSGSISLIHFGQFQTQNLRRIVHIPLLRWVPSNEGLFWMFDCNRRGNFTGLSIWISLHFSVIYILTCLGGKLSHNHVVMYVLIRASWQQGKSRKCYRTRERF